MSGRAAATVVAVAAFVAWDALMPLLPQAPRWLEVALVACIGLPLIGLVVVSVCGTEPADLPLTTCVALVAGGVAAAVLASAAGWVGGASAAKALAAAGAGCLVARVLGTPLEAALVAVLVIGVDAYSVFAGPTKQVVAHHPQVLSAFSVDVAGPGVSRSGSLGVTDLFFLALLTRAAARLRLEPRAAAAAMCASLGASYVVAVVADRAVPALPLLSLAWLAANARPLRAALRRARR